MKIGQPNLSVDQGVNGGSRGQFFNPYILQETL